MQAMVNLKDKYREPLGPFAPSVLREDVAEWFEREEASGKPPCAGGFR